MQYYGTRLTENISRREPEGYLLCLNVPVARTGTQEYLPEELGLPPGAGMISVARTEEEVFAPETVASFEGMPVTNDHPPDGVDIDNIRRLQMGHVHHVRRGSGEEADLLLADLIITDERLIDAILSGKREISCGYTYELHEENGQYFQRKIRGNHIAVVNAGRAGPRVSIKDHKRPERSIGSMKKSLTKLLARVAKDGDVDTVAEFIAEMMGETGTPETPAEAVAEAATEAVGAVEEAVEAAAEEPAAVVVTDEDNLAGVIQRLDQLIALLTPAAPAEPEIPAGDGDVSEEIAEAVEETLEAVNAEEGPAEEPEPAVEEELAEIVESILEPEISTTIGEEKEEDSECEEPENPGTAEDDLRTLFKAFRPVIAGMPREQRRTVCADIAANLRENRRPETDRLIRLMDAMRRKPPTDPRDLGKRIMASRNPNYKE